MAFRRLRAMPADADLALPVDRAGRVELAAIVGRAAGGGVVVVVAAGVGPAASVVVRRAAAETAKLLDCALQQNK
jgi:hypothetical protein